ncbi:MAG TPA: GreA/GreB family elongation factor [Steroidobacteraceae bacterium]
MKSRIVLSRQDFHRLRSLLIAQRFAPNQDEQFALWSKLDQASIVESEELPKDAVGIDSTVIVTDLDSGAHNHYTIVLPPRADVSAGCISVLAPLGTALLGYRVGDVVEWEMPGRRRKLRIEAVRQDEDSRLAA